LYALDPLVDLTMPQVKQPYSNTADWHGVSKRTVWHWIEEGMPHVKDGMPRTPVRVNTVEADNWLFQPRLNKEVLMSCATEHNEVGYIRDDRLASVANRWSRSL
jgi:hypothetical protein